MNIFVYYSTSKNVFYNIKYDQYYTYYENHLLSTIYKYRQIYDYVENLVI